MASFDTPLGPSITLSCALFRATYSPAGLDLALCPRLLTVCAFLQTHMLVIASIILFSTLLHRQSKRLAHVERAPRAPPDYTPRMLALLRLILHVIRTTQSTARADLVHLADEMGAAIHMLQGDVTAIDEDIVSHTAHLNWMRNCIRVLDGNVECARVALDAVFPDDTSHHGVQFGDDVEVFLQLKEYERSKRGDIIEVDKEEKVHMRYAVEELDVEEIDVEASNTFVGEWLEDCPWVEDMEDMEEIEEKYERRKTGQVVDVDKEEDVDIGYEVEEIDKLKEYERRKSGEVIDEEEINVY
ncbi:hypothetical protein ACEQ8H_003479 [Pleosporales sp. CAS-2024a]